MSDIMSLIRSDLAGFTGYSSAAKESANASPAAKLDANECPWPPFGPMAGLCSPNRYGEPQPAALRARMAAHWGVDPDEILTTCGSDQGIDVLMRLFCAAGRDNILICPPTFVMYVNYAKLQGASVLSVPLTPEGRLDVSGIAQMADDRTKLIFIPTPNAPTGLKMETDDLLALCAARDGKSVIVADEAYVEFADDTKGMAPYLNKAPNLVLLRTLSKAHALAGERVGCIIAPQKLIAALSGVVPPYPISQSAVRAALDALSPEGLAQSAAYRETIRAERALMARKLATAADVVRVYPSQGNFLFLETKDAAAFMARLAAAGAQARRMDAQIKGAVRLTIGTPQENELVLKALGV